MRSLFVWHEQHTALGTRHPAFILVRFDSVPFDPRYDITAKFLELGDTNHGGVNPIEKIEFVFTNVARVNSPVEFSECDARGV